jgi:hypothetical protein
MRVTIIATEAAIIIETLPAFCQEKRIGTTRVDDGQASIPHIDES